MHLQVQEAVLAAAAEEDHAGAAGADDPPVDLRDERRGAARVRASSGTRCSHSAALVTIVGFVTRSSSTIWSASASGSVVSDLHTRHVLAAILTIGNELVSGDTENTNASWLARRLEALGVRVAISAAVPDETDRIVEFVRRERERVDHLLVTGGLGGTPDDITREALAAAFDVPQEVVPELEADLRSRFRGDPEYVARWAALPRGSRPLDNPLGGAPGFRIANTWVLPGLPSEMKAMFDRYADELRGDRPIETWRRRLATRESTIASALERGDRALAGASRSAPTRASTTAGPRSRWCSNRPIRTRSQRRNRGSRRSSTG